MTPPPRRPPPSLAPPGLNIALRKPLSFGKINRPGGRRIFFASTWAPSKCLSHRQGDASVWRKMFIRVGVNEAVYGSALRALAFSLSEKHPAPA